MKSIQLLTVLLRREGDAVRGAAGLLPELRLHLQQHVPHAGEGGLHAGPDLQRLIVSAAFFYMHTRRVKHVLGSNLQPRC